MEEKFTPELRLLIDLISDTKSAELTLPVKEWEGWQHLPTLIKRHRVDNLVLRRAKEHLTEFPVKILQKIKERETVIMRRNLKLSTEVFRLAGIFREEGIRMLVLKGSALSMQLYGDMVSRQSRDIDLIIPAEEIQHAIGLLLKQGYQYSPAIGRYSNSHLEQYIKAYQHIGFFHPERRIPLEVHWRMFAFGDPGVFEFGQLWQNRQNFQLGEHSFDCPDYSDHLHYVCLHGLFHLWYQLSWVADVAQAMRTSHDWSALIEKSRQNHTFVLVSQAIQFANKILGVPVPSGLTDPGTGRRFITQTDKLCLKALTAPGHKELSGPVITFRRAIFFMKVHRIMQRRRGSYLQYFFRKAKIKLSIMLSYRN